MLYLEDYLEMIEHLPQELRDRFTEMREMDLSVQNNMDSLDKRARTLFQQCRRGELVGTQADGEFYAIRKDYYRVLEDSDEKVQLAGQMYDLVDRYLRRLDSELYKFKCELEADHNGITEILEKRSLELDTSTSNGGLNQKENRYFDTLGGISSSIVASSAARVDNRYKIKPEKRRDSIGVTALSGPPPEKRQAVAASASAISSGPPVRPTTPLAATGGPYHMLASTAASSTPNAAATSVAYNLQQFGAGNAIAAAASQAIAATQQMQQGRRTASLKASYEAIHGAGATGTAAHDLLINRELAGATHNALQAVERETSNAFSNQQRRQHKKKLTTGTSAADLLEPPTVPGVLSAVASGSSTSSLSGTSSSAGPSNSSGSIGGVGGGGGVGSSVSGGGATLPPLGTGIVLNENGMVVEQTPEGEWTYDPNEPRYCICNQVSYGDMVACDNEDCPFEWFHYPCVNITSSPKGKWYCPQCSSSMKRRASRKN
ncbi:inhibitor of growth protein 3 isoform X2 [Toxorhynchites rutilus septentrionalis]|uniref:inhibitor of growth protein 3 isoform X2 n=1 Tax=Toxorhynchites rutilus septentrionalis TaxID=329112 RepID=UPI0024791404|nr:inhibitor of growth protein 3 isoform X2 [Toxorhynchites rutilus septentrionalis]